MEGHFLKAPLAEGHIPRTSKEEPSYPTQALPGDQWLRILSGYLFAVKHGQCTIPLAGINVPCHVLLF